MTASVQKIIIIGGGLGGLTAAYCFARDGFEVVLLERRQQSDFHGGVIGINRNASRFLIRWGLETRISEVAHIATGSGFYDAISGNLLYKRSTPQGAYPFWITDRKTTQRILCEEATKQGAVLRFGAEVADIGEGADGATVVLSSGETLTADLVLVAVGITSRLRPKVLQSAWQPSFVPQAEGSANHQIEVPGSVVKADERTKEFVEDHNLSGWTRPRGKIVLRFNTKTDTMHALFCISDPENLAFKTRLWDERGDIEYVREQFKDCHSSLRVLLDLAQSCDCWREAQMPDLPTWTSDYGRLVLLGDSAHAMYPDLAQGYSQIVEDIATLHYLLRESKAGSLKEVISMWEGVRKPRVERIKSVAYASHQAWVNRGQKFAGKQPAPPTTQTNGEVSKPVDVGPDMFADYNTPQFMKWLLDVDVVEEAKNIFDGRSKLV